MRDLTLPTPFDVRALADQIAARRGRPIQLIPMARLTGVCGLWIATDTTDLIFYEEETTLPHQEHIILHELSHVLCHHDPAPLPLATQARQLLPDVDPVLIQRILGRAGYSTEVEREAETLASLIRQRARPDTGRTPTGRLHAALDDRGHD